jgi:hypothetical protein
VERAVCRWADEHGIYHTKFTPQGKRGLDRIFWRPRGQLMVIEFKRPGKRPTKLQIYNMEKLRKLDYDVRWTDNKDEAIDWLHATT